MRINARPGQGTGEGAITELRTCYKDPPHLEGGGIPDRAQMHGATMGPLNAVQQLWAHCCMCHDCLPAGVGRSALGRTPGSTSRCRRRLARPGRWGRALQDPRRTGRTSGQVGYWRAYCYCY